EKEKVKFVLIGSGPHEDHIYDYIEELELGNSVISLGKINYDIIHEYYNMMDIMIYPKKAFDWCKHTTSYKVIEAMSMGKAIIMSNFIKQEGVVFVEPENLNDLFEKVKTLIADPEKRNNYGENARQWVLENRQNSKISLLD
ncbi:MAG: glycosyltransferase, partial [Nitrososphaeraceae archaeon]|nr:glycosyltransferase [Nitrososphaeraceae archaeon]